MLTLNYVASQKDSDFTLVVLPDGQIEQWVKTQIDLYLNHYLSIDPNYNTTLHIGSEMIITQFRVAVKLKWIESKHLIIAFNGQILEIEPISGRLENWPNGFCDTWDKMLNTLIGWDDYDASIPV